MRPSEHELPLIVASVDSLSRLRSSMRALVGSDVVFSRRHRWRMRQRRLFSSPALLASYRHRLRVEAEQ